METLILLLISWLYATSCEISDICLNIFFRSCDLFVYVTKMSAPTETDLSTIFKRLRSLQSNKVSAVKYEHTFVVGSSDNIWWASYRHLRVN